MKSLKELISDKEKEYNDILSIDSNALLYKEKELINEFNKTKAHAKNVLNNPELLKEEIEKSILFGAICYIDAMRYAIENNINLDDVVEKAKKVIKTGGPLSWANSEELSQTEKALYTRYTFGISILDIAKEDAESFGGIDDKNFLKNAVKKMEEEYNIDIESSLPENYLTTNKKIK